MTDAFYWAEYVGGPGAVPFGSLAKGERFRYPKHDDIFVKTGIGRLKSMDGKSWRTGQKTAVIPIDDTE